MKMNFHNSIMVFGLMTCFTQVSFASPLNIDFGREYTGLPSSYGAASSQIGHWNDIVGNSGLSKNLLNTAGVATGIDLTLSNTSDGGIGGATDNDSTLLYDNFYSSSPFLGPWSVSLSGIKQGMYDIYYYAPAHSSISTGVFSINGTNVSNLTGSLSLTQGISWDVLSGVTIDNSGILIIQSESNTSLLGLSGLQIVPVPVPAAIWLLGSGLVGLIGMRKKPSKISALSV